MTGNRDADYALDMGTDSARSVLKDYYERSKIILAAQSTERDIAYGDLPTQTFSIAWPAQRATTRLAVVFFHGGWWKAGNKEDRMFLAETLCGEDIAFISVGYPLTPAVRLRALTNSAATAVAAVIAHLATSLGHPVPIVLAGNSAGGHVAAHVTGTLAALPEAAAACNIVGMCVASGLYNLAPLRSSFANEWLQLSEDDLAKLMPIRWLPDSSLPIMVAAGSLEPAGFLAQQVEYVNQLCTSGAAPQTYLAPGHDHFTIIGEFGRVGSPIYNWLLQRRVPAPVSTIAPT